MASESEEEVHTSFLREPRLAESGLLGRLWGAVSTYCVLPFVVGTSLGLGYAFSAPCFRISFASPFLFLVAFSAARSFLSTSAHREIIIS